ncbi:sporulation protein YunB [Brevibacillus sp. H7]|uniref:sporulation protein YunB n=1 Tax=Brevibacillus sp. H7 TaxID=3349138 RepID=UPI003809A285
MGRFRYRRTIRWPIARMSKPKIYFWTLIVFIVLTVQSVYLIEQRLEPTLLILAKQKSEQLAKEAMNDALTKKISQMNLNFDEIVKMQKDAEGKIRGVNLEFKEYSRIVGESTQRIKSRLKELEEENIKSYIPLGLATGNSFLSDIGPKIPITFVPIGSVKTRLDTKLVEAGINMVMVTVFIYVEVNLRIVIPFATDQTTVTTEIPITHSLVIGDVPSYWYNNPEGKPDVPLIKGPGSVTP